jgi:arylsulfatase A-like enzyme
MAGILAAVAVGCARGDAIVPYRGSLDHLETAFEFAAVPGSARELRETGRISLETAEGQRLLVDGWAEPEVDPATGETFVWATAAEASLEVVVLRAEPAVLGFRCRPFAFGGAPPQRVEVLVNGDRVDSVDLGSGAHDYQVTLASHALRPGRNLVTLRFAWAESPQQRIAGSDDSRTLAAAFQDIRVVDGESEGIVAPRASRVEGGALLLEPGSALVYTVVPEGRLVLDPGVEEAGGRPLVWVGDPGGERRWLTSNGRGARATSIGWPAGKPLQVGFVAAAGAEAPATLSVRPRLLGAPVRTATSLLLIVMDTLRADFVGAYGGSTSTPVIDSLADRGTLFDRAYSHIAITGPSHASLFTSLLPFEHGVRNNARVLDSSAQTLAEVLRRRGWSTAAVVSLGVLKREFGFDQGFAHYRDQFGDDWMKDAGEVTAEANPLLSEALVEPFFLWVHYSDPHEPYTPPNLDYPWVDLDVADRVVGTMRADGHSWTIPLTLPPGAHPVRFRARRAEDDPGRWYRLDAVRIEGQGFDIRAGDWEIIEHPGSPPTFQAQLPASLELVNASTEARTVSLHVNFKQRLDIPEVRVRYGQEVEYADEQIGLLLDAMESHGLLDNTLVVFTSDHGEGLGNHNHVGHIHQVYDTLIKVPLILALPGAVPAGLRVSDPVALVDLFPTVTELLGLEGPSPASGRSLVPLLRGEPVATRAVIAQTYRPEAFTDKRAILLDGFKYIHSWSPQREWEELYDLEADPGELVDLIDTQPEVAARLRTALAERLASTPEGSAAAAELSETDRDRLRALGYVH